MLEKQEFYSVGSRIKGFKKSGRYEEAAEEIHLGLEKNPDDLFLKASLADLYARQGRLIEGRILVEEVLFRDPQHPQALSVLGDIFLKQHAPQEALECYRQAFNRDLAQWDEVKLGLPPREGLERFLSAASREPFLSKKLERLAGLRSFFDYAERILFVYQYITDPRLAIPDQPVFQSLKEERNGLLRLFEAGSISIDAGEIQILLDRFQKLRESYIQVYTEAHQKDRSGEQFSSYEKLRQSKRYFLLTRLDQLEMVSVKHNRSSVDRILATVLSAQCHAPTLESLQSSPICRCGYVLGEELTFTPAREIEEAVDVGIMETVEALKSSAYQEKLSSYLNGLQEIGEKEKALAIQKVLDLSPARSEDFISKLDEALTPAVIQGINEAFRGRMVVVSRNLDDLYGALIRRKYTLPQIKKIFREWLKEEEISEGTFVHFMAKEDEGQEPPDQG